MPDLKLSFFGHGGDYNPDQWRDYPGILEEDIRLMKLSRCNLMSVGIFSWTALEPEEGKFDFDWLENVLNRLHENGIYAFLATPSGACPAWMSAKYPEVLRVRPDGGRNLHGERHNHCPTSPVYRRFVKRINSALAERFSHHPAVVGWHVSNEYGGDCHCELCQNAFREYLKKTYGTLDKLNAAWWTGFWSKTYTDWNQLHSPTPIGEMSIHGLNLSWKRFQTAQTVDFMRAEIEPLRAANPSLPITTNFHGDFHDLDYRRFAGDLDFASYDNYPAWGRDDAREAMLSAFKYDFTRSILNKPFALMESTPSQVNWQEVCKLKKPGMHLLSSIQAVAHGADTVQYFQWRKGRGASEKFHGAVVDHEGSEHTRTFREVAEVGKVLETLAPVLGSTTHSDAAVIYDIDNRWAIENSQGPRRDAHYFETVLENYAALSGCGVNVDVIEQTTDFSGYKLIVAPMLYMLGPGVAERMEAFVRSGGTLVATCRTGIVDQDDLCFLGGFPGPLRKLLGIWAEETDALWDDELNHIHMKGGSLYACSTMCDLIHAEDAEVLGVYADDFYAGSPAVTRAKRGEGSAWYIATRPDQAFLNDFYRTALKEAGVQPLVNALPAGVRVAERSNGAEKWLFAMNFSPVSQEIELPKGVNVLTGEKIGGATVLKGLGFAIVQTK